VVAEDNVGKFGRASWRGLILISCLFLILFPAPLRAQERWFTTLYYGLHSVNTIGTAVHDFETDTNRYAGVGLGRVLLEGKYLSLEAEGIFAEHFGGFGEYAELVAALNLRYHYFPWDRYLKTTVAICDGPSYAAKKIDKENRTFMNFLSAEITLSPPAVRQLAFVAKLHHRSGGDGWLNLAKGESNFYTFGLRYLF
jgi:hypothetical protein